MRTKEAIVLLTWQSLLVLVMLTVAGTVAAAPSAAPAAPPPPEVSVITVHSQSVPFTRDSVGRLAATRIAEVRARVAGILQKRTYTEGTDVPEGKVLFQIDPDQQAAALHAAQAALAKANAEAINATLTAKRYSELHAKKLLAQQDLDTALANERTAAAGVQQAQANVEIARLNLGYATVVTPIAGRAGRATVTEGALVGQGEATALTTIEQIDPIYVNFTLSSAEFSQMSTPSVQSKVEVLLPDGSLYPRTGTLDFADLAVISATGTVALRGVLPNPDHRLLPGMFVKVRLTAGSLDHAFVLPQATVLRDSKGAYALVVVGSGRVEQRRVETRAMTHSDWVVTGSLADGDQVITDGLQKVRLGGEAKAKATR